MALNAGFEYREQIGDTGQGSTALAYLSRRYRHSSEAEWLARIHAGQVFLDGMRAHPNSLLKPGQWLTWQRPPWDEPDVPLSFAVLHEDRDLLAVAKPNGLPTAPAGGFLEHTLLMQVRKHYPEATPVHRLGRGTSGVVLFSRTVRSRSPLATAWRTRNVVKIYRALASGIPKKFTFTIDIPIGPVPHPKLGTLHAASMSGKRAVSRVKLLEPRKESSLLEVKIETGRPHQIRIHLAAAGHPLVGDPLYASGGLFKEAQTALPGDIGYLLHAHKLLLKHPATGNLLELECPPPPGLRFESEN